MALRADLDWHAWRFWNFPHAIAHRAQRAAVVGAPPEARRTAFVRADSIHGQYSVLKLVRVPRATSTGNALRM